MPEMRHVAVIDLGKTNAKVALFDLTTAQELERFTTANRALGGAPYQHFDTEALWAFMLQSLRQLAEKHEVHAISITTHGATAALLNANGSLALPILDYEDDGPHATATEYDALRPAFAETGSPRLPNGLNLGAQIFWQQCKFPEAFAKVRWIVTYPQYWAYRLCGVLANEVTSLGCHTDLWAYAKGDYSSLVDTMDWRKLMPPLRKANEQLGFLRGEGAERTGLPPQTPIYCGLHDSNASLFPHLTNQLNSFSVVSTGTWVVCMAVGGTPMELDAARDTLMNVNAFGQPVPSSRFMGGREFQILSEQFGGSPTEADAKAVFAAGAMLLPSVVLGSGPFPNRAMQWVNGDSLTPAQRQVCASYYLALMTAICLHLIGAQGETIVEGPFAGNSFYLQMLQAATGRSIKLSPSTSTGTTLGAALLASKTSHPIAYGASVLPALAAAQDYAAQWFKRCGMG